MKFALTLLSLLPIINAVPLLTTQDVIETTLLPTQIVSDYTTALETIVTSIEATFTTEEVATQMTMQILETDITTATSIEGVLTTAVDVGATITTTDILTATPIELQQINVQAFTSEVQALTSAILTALPTEITFTTLATATTEEATPLSTDLIASATSEAGDIFASATSALGGIIPTALPSLTAALPGVIATATNIGAEAIQSATSILGQVPTEVSSWTSIAGQYLPTAVVNSISGALPTEIVNNENVAGLLNDAQTKITDLVAYLQSQGQNADQINAYIAQALRALNIQQ